MDNNITLSKQHIKRLRHYFRKGTYHSHGPVAMGDNIDLDLLGWDLIERDRSHHSYSSTYFVITPKGEKTLYEEKQKEILRRSPHHELGERLGAFLRTKGRITWENIQFQVEYMENGQIIHDLTRPDVYSMMPTFNERKFNPIVHEVKVRRSDFLSDRANERKRANYKLISERFYYVCPKDLILPTEVPDGCGLVYEINQNHFDVVKNAKLSKVSLRPRDFMNLILKPGQFESLY
jgi:hypothetical protein